MKANTPAERLVNGIIKENPTFVLVSWVCVLHWLLQHLLLMVLEWG